jgi:hypothetical protein
MTHLLATLREVTPDRHNRAVQGLRDHSLTVTLVKQSEAKIRAIVRNGEKEYRVIINDAGALCSCPDAFYRGPCKHIASVCISVLQHNDQADTYIHLMWPDGQTCCGEPHPTRFWQNWSLNALNWSAIVCPACVQAWTHPAVAA